MLITTDYPPDTGGVAWYYENLVTLRQAQGDTTFVLKLGKWALTPRWPFIFFILIIKSFIIRPTCWWVGQVLPIGTVAWVLSFVWKKPYIVSTHGMDVLISLHSPRKRWLVGKILARAALITANSEWTKRKILTNYKLQIINDKIIVVYPEPKPKRVVREDELQSLRLKLGIPNNAKVLLTVSRLVARKGIDRVLYALHAMGVTNPGLHYVIVGEGIAHAQLEHVCGQISDNKRVHFAGSVSDDELPAYYTFADAFILLSRDIHGDVEGFGIVYLEANQYGLPIVATGEGGTQEALAQCRKVIPVINGDDIQEVAHAVSLALI